MNIAETDFPTLEKRTGPEPFFIDSDDFNDVMDWFFKNHSLAIGPSVPRRHFQHPWITTLKWNFDLQQWTAQVWPGFVRGHTVRVNVPAYLTSVETRKRLELDEDIKPSDPKIVKAFLTELPRIPIENSKWRTVVGPDTETAAGGEGIPIPEVLFSQFNVKVDNVVTINRTGDLGISVDVSGALLQDTRTARQLRSMEINLFQPRPTIEAVVVDTSTVGVDQFGFQIVYNNPTTDPPFLQIQRESPIDLAGGPVSVIDALVEAQDPFDIRHIATIWLLGPPGDLTSQEVDETWLPLMDYSTMWNLDYVVNAEIDELEPQVITNPAGFLTGGAAAQPIIDSLNEQDAQIRNLLSQANVNGDFWTV